ncbi:MAG: HK97 family phage prohead protease [Homoserinimonas sp.]
MITKSCQVKVKAGPDDGLEEGQFTAYASVFGNKDSYGDVVVPGAFAGTLQRWAAKESLIPLLFGHNMSDPDFNIGSVDAVEDDHGLLVTGTIDMDQPKGLSTYRAMKGKRLNQMSFAYDVLEGGLITKDGDEFYELRELELFEVSVVTIGANQETEILAVKSAAQQLAAGVKAGRVISAKNEGELRTAYDSIGKVLAALDTDDDSKASGHEPAKDEEPPAAKSEEPTRAPSALTRLHIDLATAEIESF